ncbi:MAG: hypothetical protein AAFO94_08625 [Bacteroidota bacterium]
MKRKYVIGFSMSLLFLTVPWFFFGHSERSILGFPIWAFYSISLTLIYALSLIFLLGKVWDQMEE